MENLQHQQIKPTLGAALRETNIFLHSNKSHKKYPGFPVEIFPETLQKLINDSHQFLGFPRDITASGILFAVSVAMGQSIKLKTPLNYEAKPIIWLNIVSPRGSTKSHPINRAVQQIITFAGERYEQYQREITEFIENNKEGKRPKFINPITRETTIEGLHELLKNNAHGLGLNPDELRNLIGNFNRYNHGSDIESFLSLFDGGGLSITRKTQDPIWMKETFVSIIGTVQPGAITETFNQKMIENGFTDRFMSVFPNDIKFVELGTQRIDESIWENYDIQLNNLLKTAYEIDNFMPLRIENEAGYLEYYNQLGREMNGMSDNDPRRGINAKLQTMLPRFCLLSHGLRVAFENKGIEMNIDEVDIQRAITLSEYFKIQNIRLNEMVTDALPIDMLPDDKAAFYNSLPLGEFSRDEAVQAAKKFMIIERNVDRFLKKRELFNYVGYGTYSKKY